MPSVHGIIDLDAFKTLTKPFQQGTRNLKHAFSGRGGNMKLVDQALKNYWEMHRQFSHQNVNDFRIVSALHGIITACNVWLGLKADGADDGLTGKRRAAITDLRTRAILGKNKAGGVRPGTTLLAGGYTKESASARFDAQGRKVASSASSVVALHAALPTMDPATRQGVDPHAHQVLSNFNLATMSQGDFQAIAAAIGAGGGGDVVEPELVRYLKKADRITMVAFPRNGQLLGMDGGVFDTGMLYGDPAKRMYALDKYGNLVIRCASGKMDGMNFNHSSLVQGKEVLCAGEIIVRTCQGRAGQLVYINNNSGHYQPGTAALQTAVMFLQSEGMNIDNTKVENVVPGVANGPWHGNTFLANPIAASDWLPGEDQTYGVRT